MRPIAVQPVILCGGSGARLWPISRADFPKQFLKLWAQESLFEQAILRAYAIKADGMEVADPLIVGNEEHRFLLLNQCDSIQKHPKSIILEPCGRNTAPAVTFAALAAHTSEVDPVLVITPADHAVRDNDAFITTLRRAIEMAAEGDVVTLGISPDRPETGYGYIRVQENSIVKEFVEKPDLPTAEAYLRSGNYYWNSGIFVVRASVWKKLIRQFRPDIADATELAWRGHQRDGLFLRPEQKAFLNIPAESIDYAVMEKCPGSDHPIAMLPLDAGWSDLGSWEAAWQVAPKDASGNSAIGDAMIQDSRNVFVHADNRLVSVVGLENVVVVETADAVLVADRTSSQNVRKIVNDLGVSGRGEHTQHRKVHRPWGWYDSIDQGPGFKVKRIMVKPGGRLSLQKHDRRAEHWVVVSGTAEVTCGEKTMHLYANQSTYIPPGEMHRLVNPGDTPLEIIEVQSGDYLGEDDITRFDDQYGRA